MRRHPGRRVDERRAQLGRERGRELDALVQHARRHRQHHPARSNLHHLAPTAEAELDEVFVANHGQELVPEPDARFADARRERVDHRPDAADDASCGGVRGLRGEAPRGRSGSGREHETPRLVLLEGRNAQSAEQAGELRGCLRARTTSDRSRG
jgi:hypothetical protein